MPHLASPSLHYLLFFFLFLSLSVSLPPSISRPISPTSLSFHRNPGLQYPGFRSTVSSPTCTSPLCYIYSLTCSLSSRLFDLASYNPPTTYTPRACTPQTSCIHSHTHAHVPFSHVFPAVQPKIAETLNHRVQPADHSSPARPVPFYSRPAHIHTSSSPRRAIPTRLS